MYVSPLHLILMLIRLIWLLHLWKNSFSIYSFLPFWTLYLHGKVSSRYCFLHTPRRSIFFFFRRVFFHYALCNRNKNVLITLLSSCHDNGLVYISILPYFLELCLGSYIFINQSRPWILVNPFFLIITTTSMDY